MFLQKLIPVDLSLWIFFFLLPMIAAAVSQFLLFDKAKKKLVMGIPAFTGALLVCLVLLYRFTGFLSFLIGGFVALLLLGTAMFIWVGCLAGAAVYRLLRRKRNH